MQTVASLLLVSALALLQQSAPQPGATLEGVVVDAASGMPLKGAQVLLLGRLDQAYRRVISDDRGAFAFTGLTPGDVVLTVSLADYLGTRLQQQVTGIISSQRRVALTRTSSVSGRVYDSNRKPVAGVEIKVLRDAYDAAGRPSLAPLDLKFIRTDEKGDYQVTGLPPGYYYIRAAYAAEPAKRTIGALVATANNTGATYYPGVNNPDNALPIKISPGDEVQALDFSIEDLSPFKVSGRIVNSLVTTPVDRYSYFLIRRDSRLHDGDGLVPDMDPDIEHFEFRHIPPGSYDLYVAFRSGPSLGDPFLVGRSTFDVVDRDIADITVAIESGIDIGGTWHSDDSAGTKMSERGPIGFQPLDGMPEVLVPKPALRDDGTLVAHQIPAGRYVLSFALPQPLYVGMARFGSRDVIGQPFDVDANSAGPLLLEFSTSGGSVSGTVTDKTGKTVADTLVALLPPQNLRMDQSSFRAVSTDAWGQFAIVGIRPGVYTIFALSEKLESYTNIKITHYLDYGTRIEVRKNQRLLQDLTLIPRQ